MAWCGMRTKNLNKLPRLAPCPKCSAPKARRVGQTITYRCQACEHLFAADLATLEPEPEPMHAKAAPEGETPPVGASGILFLDAELNYAAYVTVPATPVAIAFGQVCIAGDPSTGGHIAVVKCGVTVDGPKWSFRIGARTERVNEDKTAPEPEWAITVVEALAAVEASSEPAAEGQTTDVPA